MKQLAIILMLLFANSANADEMQHFNPEIIGKTVGDCVLFLSPSTEDAIKPIQLLADINERGIYYGAMITYPEALSFDVAKKSINKLYKKYEVPSFANDPDMGIWRNEDRRFSIQLSTKKECNGKVLQVIYISLDR